ncbi:hypothetical protein P3T76_009004 [Phytophthora citrophthora]|uniref:Uncharacterized protein n=1 Tax=Phytophthora citrophthora TaxID=4793 RepID=A0AAD9GIA4_9STRA|nr:hypothetical protein P3T76_009004 [Phytophthora citrophthora]
MSLRTLGVLLATLCVLTTSFVSGYDMATNSSASASGSGSETVAQLLADVQAAVADDPALANMFDISSASQMSEEELTTLLQELLDVTSSSTSASVSISSSGSNTQASAESTQSESAAGSSVSAATTVALSTTMAVLATMVALGAVL